MSVLLLTSVSAIYAGECSEDIDLSSFNSSEDIVYLVVGNSSNTEGMKVNLTGMIVNVCFAVNYEPDSFTIVFMDNSTKETIVEVPVYYRSGGGGTKTIYLENKTTEYIDNKTIEYVDRIIDLTKETTPTEETTIAAPEEPKKSYLIWYISIVALILIIGYLFYRTFSEEPEENEIEEPTDEIEKTLKELKWIL